MAEVQKFNWAQERASSTMIEGYRKVWLALLGTEKVNLKDENGNVVEFDPNKEFESFLNKCASGFVEGPDGKREKLDINGVAFQNELKKNMKLIHHKEYEECGKDDGAFIKKIAADKLKDDNVRSMFSYSGSFDPEKRSDMENASLESSTMAEAYLVQASMDGWFPYDTTMTAGYEVAKGQNLQMECGGGKTTVLVFAANHQVRNDNKQVFLTSSTKELAQQTFEETVEKYDRLNIKDVVYISQESITRVSRDENGEIARDEKGAAKYDVIKKAEDPIGYEKAVKEAYASGKIVVADNATIMQHKMAGLVSDTSPEFKGGRSLLADEGDYVLLDEYQAVEQLGEEYSPKVAEQRGKYREIASMIIQDIKEKHKKSPLYTLDEKTQYVDFNDAGKTHVAKTINGLAEKFPNIDRQQLADFVYEALVVETLYKEGREFQIDKDEKTGKAKIVSSHKASGTAIDLPQGIEQALYFKYKREHPELDLTVPQEKQVLKQITVKSAYSEIFKGQTQSISGTLGVESTSQKQKEELAEKHNITESNTYACSVREDNRLQREDIQVFESRAELDTYCIEEAVSVATTGHYIDGMEGDTPIIGGTTEDKKQEGARPVLLNVDNVQQVEGYVEALKGRGVRVLTYTATSEAEFKRKLDAIDNEQDPVEKEKFVEAFESEFGIKLKRDESGQLVTAKDKEGNDTGKVDWKANNCKDYATFIKKCAGTGHTVIVGTGIIGRGTNVGIKEAKPFGGLHVVIAGTRDTSSRDPLQIEKRAARGSDPGSVRETICLEDMPNDLREAYEAGQITAEQLKEAFYERVDERQATVRGNTYALDEALQEAYKDIDKAFKYLKFEDKEERANRAKALLTARAMSIQTRASGNTNEKRHAAYKSEITVFKNLYIAKFKEAEPSKFDEKGWLNRGHKKVAETYMSFTESEVEMIVAKFNNKALSMEEIEKMIESSDVSLEDVKAAITQMQEQEKQKKRTAQQQIQEKEDEQEGLGVQA